MQIIRLNIIYYNVPTFKQSQKYFISVLLYHEHTMHTTSFSHGDSGFSAKELILVKFIIYVIIPWTNMHNNNPT